MQDILNVNAKELASAAAFQGASTVYADLTSREGFFITDQSAEDDEFPVLQSAIETLGTYAIDRRPSGAVVVTHAMRLGYLNAEQESDIYCELALHIFTAHAIAAHDAIVALQTRIREALKELGADEAGRVTTMPLKDSIFRPIGTGLEMDPERVAALALGARTIAAREEQDGHPRLSLGKPEKPNVGAMALGTIAEGEGDGTDSGDDGKGNAAGAAAGQAAGAVSRYPADAADDDRGADDSESARSNPAHGSAKPKRTKAKS